MKPMLVLVTSEKCGACKAFKSNVWPRLGTYLKKDPRFDVTEVHVMSNTNEIRRVHTDLLRFVSHFPTLIMFTGASWLSTSLIGTVLNAEFVDGKMTLYHRIPAKAKHILPLQHKPIYDWVESVLEKPEFATQRPRVVITDEPKPTFTGGRSSSSMYNSKIEFVENEYEYI